MHRRIEWQLKSLQLALCWIITSHLLPCFFITKKPSRQARICHKTLLLCLYRIQAFYSFYVGISDNITRAMAMAVEKESFYCGMGSGIENEKLESDCLNGCQTLKRMEMVWEFSRVRWIEHDEMKRWKLSCHVNAPLFSFTISSV